MKTLLRFALFMAAALALVACSNMLTDLQPSADSKAATADKAALELALSGTDALTNVTGSFALPSAGAIVWASDNAAVLSADGTV
ncbi:MAG: immunoglobulin-like domain-containing protein, partial [Spirochaetales bacterium]